MHKAAQNVFAHWVPTPLSASSDEVQREEAARWIVRRLRDQPGLVPQARSTLERIKDDLERRLGRHVRAEEL